MQEKLEKHSVTRNCSDLSLFDKLFKWSQKSCKFSAFSLEFQKNFSITRTIFSHSTSEQFWWQNTQSYQKIFLVTVKIPFKFLKHWGKNIPKVAKNLTTSGRWERSMFERRYHEESVKLGPSSFLGRLEYIPLSP